MKQAKHVLSVWISFNRPISILRPHRRQIFHALKKTLQCINTTHMGRKWRLMMIHICSVTETKSNSI